MPSKSSQHVAVEFLVAIDEACRRVRARRGLPALDLFALAGLEPWIRQERYIAWTRFVRFSAALEDAIAPFDRRELHLALDLSSPAIQRFRRVLQLVTDPGRLYKGVWTWVGPRHFPLLRSRFSFPEPGLFRFALSLPARYEEAPGYFENVLVSQVVLPRIIGLAESTVLEARVASHGIEGTLRLPESRTLMARARRGLRALSSGRLPGDELRDLGVDLLHARTESFEHKRDFEELFNRNPEGLVVLDGEHVVHANPAFRQALGLDEEALARARWSELAPGFQAGAGTTALVSADGREKPFEILDGGPTRFLGRDCRLLIVRDLSATRELERKLEQQQALAVLGELAASVAHQVNTPLTVIMSELQFLDVALGDDAPQKGRLAEVITRTHKLSRTVETLVALARGRGRTSKPAALERIVEDAFELCRLKAKAQRVRLRAPQLDDAARRAELPELELVQIIVNLVSNAVDAASASDERWVELTARSEDGAVTIGIADSGPPLSPEVAAAMMRPFFTTKPSGTGLGLSVCEKLVAILGGELVPHAGAGPTRFDVKVPVAPQPTSSL